MGLYIGNFVLGTGNTTFAADTDIFIENVSATVVPAASGTDVTAAQRISFNQSGATGSLTGDDCTLIVDGFFSETLNASTPVNLNNTRVHLTSTTTAGIENWWFPTNWTNVDIYHSEPAATGEHIVGIYGNGSGTNLPTFDANDHIVTQGDGHRARSRPWNWDNIRLFGSGSLVFLINGVLPAGSSFRNIDFFPALGKGAFGELPFVSFPGARWGPFYRNFLGGNLFCRQTGGMLRDDYTALGNWVPQPQWNLIGLDGETTQVGIDANIWVIYPNLLLPTNHANLSFRGSQGVDGTNTSRATSVMGWNPTGLVDDVFMTFSGFNLWSVPQTYTGAQTTGEVGPSPVASGNPVVGSTNNGYFLVQTDVTLNDITTNHAMGEYTDKAIRLFSYQTQLDTLTGGVLNRQFGAHHTVTAIPTGDPNGLTVSNVDQINADLTWSTNTLFEFPADPFLHERALLDNAPTNNIADARFFYPELKAIAYNARNDSDARLPVVVTENSIRFLGDVNFDSGSNTAINAITNVITLNADDALNTSLVNTFDFRTAAGNSNDADWTTNTRTFTDPITIIGGRHTNFPRDLGNGVTFEGEVQLDRPTFSNVILDWQNVTIPEGSRVTFPGARRFSILGLDAASRTRVSGFDIDFLDPTSDYIFNTGNVNGRFRIVIVAADGTLGPTLAQGSVTNDTPITLTRNSSLFTTGERVRIYYKPENDLANGIAYQTTVLDTGPLSSALANDMAFTAQPALIPDLALPDPTEIYTGATITIGGSSDDAISVNIAGATRTGNDLDSGITQELLLRGTDQQQYFNDMVENLRTRDYIQMDVGSSIVNDVVLQSGNVAVQQLQGVTLTGTSVITNITVSGITVASVNIHPNPAGATISALIEAVDSSRAANGVGYILGEGADTSLLGIAPRTDDYNSDEDYTTNL